MRRTAALVVILIGLTSGCGGPTTASRRLTGLPTIVRAHGPLLVGTDMKPGVWVAKSPDSRCGSLSSSKRNFNVDHSDPGDMIAGSLQVGDKQRIVLHAGEYFFSDGQCSWSLENPAERTPDPATTAGGCAILVGGSDLVRAALKFGHRPASQRGPDEGQLLAFRLFAVVAARNKELGDAAGPLVDYLDNPDAYNVGSGTRPNVTRAVEHIRQVCGR